VSAIIDALRRGRVRPTVQPGHNAADTASVLQTMGYRQRNPEPALNQRRRIVGYTVMICIVAMFLWLLRF
jgi:hypothetical protein